MNKLINPVEKILVVAAHPDDETIGMGGSLHRFTESGCSVRVIFMSDGVTSREVQRESLTRRKDSALAALKNFGVTDVHFSRNPDNMLDTLPLLEIVKQIEFHISLRLSLLTFLSI
jgi:LmbE family N-acetylglucosaminyl deacetylase